jgi:hypothetical protein
MPAARHHGDDYDHDDQQRPQNKHDAAILSQEEQGPDNLFISMRRMTLSDPEIVA